MLLLGDLLNGACAVNRVRARNAFVSAPRIHAGADMFPGLPLLCKEAEQRGLALALGAENAFRFKLEQIIGVLKRLNGGFDVFVQRFGHDFIPELLRYSGPYVKYRISKRKFPASGFAAWPRAGMQIVALSLTRFLLVFLFLIWV